MLSDRAPNDYIRTNLNIFSINARPQEYRKHIQRLDDSLIVKHTIERYGNIKEEMPGMKPE